MGMSYSYDRRCARSNRTSADEAVLYYGHKEKWGSVFLTAFALGTPVDESRFIREIDAAVGHETHRLTFVRLHDAKNTSKSGFPIITVWWGGDRGADEGENGERGDSQLGTPWFVQDLLDNAIEDAARKLGFRSVKRLNHSAYVTDV